LDQKKSLILYLMFLSRLLVFLHLDLVILGDSLEPNKLSLQVCAKMVIIITFCVFAFMFLQYYVYFFDGVVYENCFNFSCER